VFISIYGSEVLAPCSSKVLALYSSGGFIKVFADARGGLVTVRIGK
jgi:hypothetical protein